MQPPSGHRFLLPCRSNSASNSNREKSRSKFSSWTPPGKRRRRISHMPKPDSLQGSLDLLVLKILSRRAPLHGYAIIAAIKEISSEVLSIEEGSLYPALHRMEEAGLIRAKWITKDSGRRARIYELTADGRKQ